MPKIETLQEQYDQALSSRDFEKTSAIERAIIQQHNRDGIRYLLARKGLHRVSFIDELKNPTCPWFDLKDAAIPVIIENVWRPTSSLLPKFLEKFKARCQHILVEEQNGSWQLIYFVHILLEDDVPYYSIYIGSPAANAEDLEEYPKIGKNSNLHLGLFYQAHNGFGEINREMLLPIDELLPIKHEEQRYLSFFDFASKARQCIALDDLSQENPMTYDYDRGNLRSYRPFWDFVDERLAIIDEED